MFSLLIVCTYIFQYIFCLVYEKKEIIGASVDEVKFADLAMSLFAIFDILIPIFILYK